MKPKQNHCYGHTPQIQKGAKTSSSGVERICHSLQYMIDIYVYIYIHIYGLCRSSLIMEYILVVLSARLLQSRLWMQRPMWEKQSLPQKSHLFVVSGLLELLRSFLQALFPTSAFTSFSSPVLRCWCRVLLHITRSAVNFISIHTTALAQVFQQRTSLLGAAENKSRKCNFPNALGRKQTSPLYVTCMTTIIMTGIGLQSFVFLLSFFPF